MNRRTTGQTAALAAMATLLGAGPIESTRLDPRKYHVGVDVSRDAIRRKPKGPNPPHKRRNGPGGQGYRKGQKR